MIPESPNVAQQRAASPGPLGDLVPISRWSLPLGRFFLCAGPCSAETPEQLLATARGLQKYPISFFRAGIWKPRTHPGNFEGHGIAALPWLREVKEQTGLPVGIEVACAAHVEAALAHEIDVMWIGARTTPNPFAVQDIADSLQGVDKPILVKNPVSPDLGLWIGAVERFHNAGIRKLAVIHRGFAVADCDRYRNPPLWRIPIEFKRRFPHVPIICDPSHMCGRADLIAPVAQEALDLLYDGLMVEVHRDPASAYSDNKQQLTPEQFGQMLRELKVRTKSSPDRQFQTRMQQLRAQIDQVDNKLLEVLRRRMDIIQAMGEAKRSQRVSTLQPERWDDVLKSRVQQGVEMGFSAEFLTALSEIVHEESIHWQEKPLFNGKE
jgi:chorismate mutase